MPVNEQAVRDALSRVPYPGFQRDIVSFGVVKAIRVEADQVTVRLEIGSSGASARDALESAVRTAVEALPGVAAVAVRVISGDPTEGLGMVGSGGPPRPNVAASGGLEPGLLPEVRHVVAVASGKGGVGKSTVAVNLAVALASLGARVGLLDADVYGPSIPLMLGEDRQPEFDPVRKIAVPFERHGIRFMSLGFLAPKDEAIIWRGPMVMKAIDELLRNVAWGALDVLVVDMPPGTGDTQLTLSQKVRLSGAVIVTTPQDVALADAIKGIAMFRKVGVPILGLVENMSFFACPHCDTRTDIFGHGGGKRQSDRLQVPFLGEIPLDPAIRSGGDDGRPLVSDAPDSPQAEAFRAVAAAVRRALDPGNGATAPPDKPGVFDRIRRGLTRDADA
jgi:ATP-binding protein involved in chromosome partitioning